MSDIPDGNNPIGSRQPSFKFQWKTPQVLLIVFALAILITIYQYIQMNVVAPGKEITWNEFSMKELEIARKQDRPILLWVHDPDRTGEQEKIEAILTDNRIRKSVFLLNPLTMKCPLELPLEKQEASTDQIRQYIFEWCGALDGGCLSVRSFTSASRSPTHNNTTNFHVDRITADAVAERLDEIERQ